jgi:3'(2'), 5'-bisphosphate nucleotidase
MIAALVDRLGIGCVAPCGSVGVKIARLVLGQGDLYVHDGGGAKLWDTCAPEAVLTAAGGRFSDLDGAAVDYRSADLVLRRGIVASNGKLHDLVISSR